MELAVQPDGRMVMATADVACGWRQLTHTFGFCEEARLEIPKNRILRVQARIHAWPNIFGSRLLRYPQNVYGLVTVGWGRIELRENQLKISLDIVTVESLRLQKSHLPGFYQQPTELDDVGRVRLWLSLLVVISDQSQQEYPDILEWDTQYLSAGRPGSNRRH
jgi:hypothetical protein